MGHRPPLIPRVLWGVEECSNPATPAFPEEEYIYHHILRMQSDRRKF